MIIPTKIKFGKNGQVAVAATVVFFVFAAAFFHDSAFSEEKNEVEDALVFERAKRLEGRWLRVDGGYVLALEKVGRDGVLKASYFNPDKINVHDSFWKFADGKVYVLVELRDANYPGSKYALSYDEKNDVLAGVYFNAFYQQRFEVYFVRQK